MMTGIYLHVPFCIQRCHYCDFFSSTQTDLMHQFVDACLKEMTLRSSFLEDQTVDTVYLGGGTPSLLNARELERLLNHLHKNFQLADDTEFTLEANPDDLTPAGLQDLKKLGFNRLSVGIQSFRDEDLLLMNRRHNAAQASSCIDEAYRVGFEHISIDLIYGIPGLSVSNWENNLLKIENLPVDHLSAYHLTIEPSTQFGRWKKQGRLQEIEEETSVQHYQILKERAGKMGFEQYEISNFARNEQYSRHNTKYWMGAPYLGLGPSAHSFNGKQRLWNPANLKLYLESYESGKLPLEKEEISVLDRRNETLLTGLRTIWGVSKERWEQIGHPQSWEALIEQSGNFIRSGNLVHENHRLRIHPDSWFRADGIIASLFMVE